ncbi:MAG: cobalamin biosynthesis protein CbiA [Candidatus Zixiibacteriota bacterium]
MIAFRSPDVSTGIIIIVGGYGSGKSEVSVNLARYLVANRATPDESIAIVDLDIVNPYFRSREAAAELEKLGIDAINPKGGQFYADLPIILPQIKSRLKEHRGTTVVDVGGDDAGARVLSSLADAFTPDEYELLMVLNLNRPFTSTVDGCLKMIKEIETSSRLKFTGIISNTHLMDDTDEATILAGLELAHRVSKKTGLPIVFLSATDEVLERIDPARIDVPVLALNRSLLKPWERKKQSGTK